MPCPKVRTVYLACGHVVLFKIAPPEVNDVITCLRCRGSRIVVSKYWFDHHVVYLGPVC